MSESVNPQSDAADPPSGHSPNPAVEEVVREAAEKGDNIQDLVHRLVVDLMRGPGGSMDSLRAGVRDILDTAVRTAQRLPPEKSDSVLRGVIDGMSSGIQSVAQAARYAVQEATSRGQRFAGEDLNRTVTDLNSMGQLMVDSIARASERMGTEFGTSVRELKSHTERAVDAMRPAIRESVSVMTQHPVEAATEAAGTALRGGQLLAGTFLSAVSGILSGAAEAIDPDKARRP